MTESPNSRSKIHACGDWLPIYFLRRSSSKKLRRVKVPSRERDGHSDSKRRLADESVFGRYLKRAEGAVICRDQLVLGCLDLPNSRDFGTSHWQHTILIKLHYCATAQGRYL